LFDGGGAYLWVNTGEVAELRRVTVYGNSGTGPGFPRGGGIRNIGSLTVDQSWVGHNLLGVWGAASPEPSGLGGGMFVSGSGNAIVNTTLEGNLATGGGALSTNGAVTITHATIARNGAEPGGGAMHHFGSTAQLDFRNTILAENLPVNCSSPLAFVSLGHNLDDDGSCGLAAAGDLVANAQLGALGNHGGPTRTILPLAGSPAIDGGTNANILVDQRGVTRPQLAQFDIGAVEVNPFDPERLPGDFLPGDSNARPHNCDLDRNGRVDFADLDRLIASFPVAGGHFRGDADRRLKTCVASCTHAGCPPVPLIHRRRWP
jgi:hypothetical protein